MTTIKQSDKQFISAIDFFSMLKTNQDFSKWIVRRIYDLKLEINHDIHIYLSDEVIMELSKIETFNDGSARKQINKILNKEIS
jgi:phage anti-repressor protein